MFVAEESDALALLQSLPVETLAVETVPAETLPAVALPVARLVAGMASPEEARNGGERTAAAAPSEKDYCVYSEQNSLFAHLVIGRPVRADELRGRWVFPEKQAGREAAYRGL